MNDVKDILITAEKLYGEKRYRQAFELYESTAEQGHVSSQTFLCYMYLVGEGVDKDLEKSYYWCSKAAASNNPEAIFYLGKLWMEKGMWSKAIQCYESARAYKYSPAIFSLGRIYYLGKVVPVDQEKAVALLSEASKLGHVIAMREYAKLLIYGKKGFLGIVKGLLLLLIWPFRTFITIRDDANSEKLRM